MAEREENSVLFSLRELKRIAPEEQPKPEKKSVAEALREVEKNVAQSRRPNDKEEAEQQAKSALEQLRQRVAQRQGEVDSARNRVESEKRKAEDLGRLEVDLTAKDQARLRGELKPTAAVALPAEPPRPPGLLLRPPVFALAAVLTVALIGGLGAYAAFRKPDVKIVTQYVAPQATVDNSSPRLFGGEIGWLDQPEVAAAASEPKSTRRRRRRRRRRRSGAAKKGEDKPKLVLPPKPTGGGFVY